MFNVAGEIGLAVFKKLGALWERNKENASDDNFSAARADSLISYTQASRVEPIVLIDTDCLYYDNLPEVLQSLLSIFAGYYLQALTMTFTVGKVSVRKHLDKLNPSRSAADNAADTMGWLLAQESYKFALPTVEKMVALEAAGDGIGGPHNAEWSEAEARDNYEQAVKTAAKEAAAKLAADKAQNKERNAQWEKDYAASIAKNEADRADAERAAKLAADKFEEDKKRYGEEKALANLRYELEKKGMELRENDYNNSLSAREMSIGKDTLKDLKELANLSVGKMFSVNVKEGNNQMDVMVNIRLMASSIPSKSLSHILSIGSEDKSMKERYHAWKAGRLEFIRDLCYCQDLIDQHRKNLMADKDGIYTNIVKRARNNQISTIVSGNPSIATASNLVVISDATVEQLELKLNGKISDFKTREAMFKNTYIMIMCVVHKQWDRVTIYHRGIHLPTEVSARDMKSANKNSGPDVSEILKAYSLGNAPSL